MARRRLPPLVRADDDEVEGEIVEVGTFEYGDSRNAEWLSQEGVRGFRVNLEDGIDSMALRD